jgi:hypothetical protein
MSRDFVGSSTLAGTNFLDCQIVGVPSPFVGLPLSLQIVCRGGD